MTKRAAVTALMNKLRRNRPTPSGRPSIPPSALTTQDFLAQSTRVAQSLHDCGALTAGQLVTIEGHRLMTVTIHDNTVTLTPYIHAPTAPDDAPSPGQTTP